MTYLSIRDLQKISSEGIAALPGPTPVKSGDRTVAMLIPMRKPNLERLAATLDRIKDAVKDIDPAEIDRFLISEGIDPTDWNDEAIRALRERG